MSRVSVALRRVRLSARGLRLAVAASCFNATITARLLRGARARLRQLGLRPNDLYVVEAPGAFELGLLAKELAMSGSYDAVLCLGAVLRGETSHYEMVCQAAAEGVLRAGLDSGVPCAFGVLTCDNEAQAFERSGRGSRNAGVRAAEAAVSMALALRRIRRGC